MVASQASLVDQAFAADGSGSRRRDLARESRRPSNIVRVFDVGRIRDEVFVVMELVAGRTLEQWLATRVGPTPLPAGRWSRRPRPAADAGRPGVDLGDPWYMVG